MRTVIKDQGTARYATVCDSYESFLELVGEVPESIRRLYFAKEFNGDCDFDGAAQLARDGWAGVLAEAETLAQHVEDKVDLLRFDVAFSSVYDVSGAEVDIDRYLAGEPENMLESVPLRISRHGRAVRLIVPIGYVADVDAKAARKRGAAILALVDLLGKAGHPVEIWAMSWANNEAWRSPAKRWGLAIRVQAATDPVDIAKIAFVLAHPAAFRVLVFARRVADKVGYSQYKVGATQELTADAIALLPETVGTDICLPTLTGADSWNEAYAVRWITDQLERIFD